MQQVLARKNVQKTTFEAAEVILDPWNQQVSKMKLSSMKSIQPQHDIIKFTIFIHGGHFRQEKSIFLGSLHVQQAACKVSNWHKS